MSAPLTLHLIGSAHLDPVWRWDWRAGVDEGIATCRAIVDLLRKFPTARFIRGEAAIYHHPGQHAAALFAAISGFAGAGRREAVRGTNVQAVNNLPMIGTRLRQFVWGKRCFDTKVGVEVAAATPADRLGHAAGRPGIFAATRITAFVAAHEIATWRLARTAGPWLTRRIAAMAAPPAAKPAATFRRRADPVAAAPV